MGYFRAKIVTFGASEEIAKLMQEFETTINDLQNALDQITMENVRLRKKLELLEPKGEARNDKQT